MTRTELRSAPKRIGGRESWRRAARERTAYRRYVEERCQLVDAVFVGRFVTDPQESMALVARPRSKVSERGRVCREASMMSSTLRQPS